MLEQNYFNLCLLQVKKLKKDCKIKYPFIRWTNKIILWAIDTPREYVSKTKWSIIKDETYKKIFMKLEKLNPDKLRKILPKINK